MNKTIKYFIKGVDEGKRVDIYLSEKIDLLTRSYIKKLINQKNLRVNGAIINTPSHKIKKEDEVILNIIEENKKNLIPKKIKIDLVYEDRDILIVNKPQGMVVHPGAGNYENTLANALAYKYQKNLSNIGGRLRPGIVHRIDKNTSGLLVIAKNNIAHSNLSKQFSNHTISRKYNCLIWGLLRPLNGKIETLITRNKKNRQLMTTSENSGKKAITNYKTLKVFSNANIPKISLIECELETGRTHQIRVHLNYKKTSIIGDYQYGKNRKFKNINKEISKILKNLNGQMLHAKTLEFIHPTKNKEVFFKSEIAGDFKKMLKLLNKLSS